MHQKIFNLITASIFTAIIFVLSLVKNLGYIEIGVVTVTIIHIPVILGAMLLPLFYTTWLGFIFGLGSLIASFLYASTPVDLLFQNPAVSILPRIVFAESICLLKLLFSKVENKKYINIVSLFLTVFLIASLVVLIPDRLVRSMNISNILFNIIQILLLFLGVTIILILLFTSLKKRTDSHMRATLVPIFATLVHTLLVISLIMTFSNNPLLNATIIQLLSVQIVLNASVEMMLAVVVVPPLYLGIKNFLNRGKYDFTL